MTKLTPGIVMDVSAIFVATTMRLVSGGSGAKILICAAGGREAYKGRTWI